MSGILFILQFKIHVEVSNFLDMVSSNSLDMVSQYIIMSKIW